MDELLKELASNTVASAGIRNKALSVFIEEVLKTLPDETKSTIEQKLLSILEACRQK